jgi:hypothetical protein
MVLFYSTQLGSGGLIIKPEPGQKDYGYTYSEDKTVIMEETVKKLAREYALNHYGTYPFAFYKEVILNKTKQSKIGDILAEITGLDKEKLDSYLTDYYSVDIVDSNSITTSSDSSSQKEEIVVPQTASANELSITTASGLTYEHFLQLITKVDKLLGGGSKYAEGKVQTNAYIPMTYEQALEEYNIIVEKDHVSGVYARVFCDYMGILLAILPVFIAVTRGLRDKRARACEIIYSRKAASYQIVLSRYLAMVVMLLIPVIVLSSLLFIDCIYFGAKAGVSIDYFAFAKYIGGWLLPTIMITTSVGVLLTELTDTAIAILVQGFWWFISLMTSNLVGNCGWNLMPRHNDLGRYSIFRDNFNQLIINRIAYAVVAILILFATIAVYEMKRKGRLNLHGTIFTNRKNKSKA